VEIENLREDYVIPLNVSRDNQFLFFFLILNKRCLYCFVLNPEFLHRDFGEISDKLPFLTLTHSYRKVRVERFKDIRSIRD